MIAGLQRVQTALRTLDTTLSFTPRADDIYLVSYPRSGTTWLQMILYQLTTDGSMEFEHIAEVIPFFERSLSNGRSLSRLPSPRIFKSHLDYPRLSRWPGRYIYIARDGRDVLISYYYFSRSQLGFRGTFENFFDLFMAGRVECGSWFKHVSVWKAHANDPKVLFLTYEDLHSEFELCLRRIAAFCGLEIRPARVPDILERCSFAFMKRHESKFDHINEVFWENGWRCGDFIREGKTGSWREHLTRAHSAAFDAESRRYGLSLVPQALGPESGGTDLGASLSARGERGTGGR